MLISRDKQHKIWWHVRFLASVQILLHFEIFSGNVMEK
jgi:hypothetical protein